MTKHGYADSLKELEKISEEIHEKREKAKAAIASLGDRGQGVGSECPGPNRTSSGIERKESQAEGLCDDDESSSQSASPKSQSAKDQIDEVSLCKNFPFSSSALLLSP